MRGFFSNVMASILGLTIFTFLVFVIFVVVISIASAEKEVEIADKSVLHLKLDQPIVERAIDDPLAKLQLLGSDGSIGLIELKDAVRHAKTDDRIKGIYLQPQFLTAGFATLQEIRDVLIDFKTSGKWIYAYGEFFTEADYYLASIADEIIINPQGVLEFNGISAEMTFFKGTLDKLGIEPEIFRVGEFKSAVEIFTREDMSAENRSQVSSYVNSIYDYYLQNVASSRNIEFAALKNVSDSMLVRTASDALDHKLVTQLAYEDEIFTELKVKLDIEEKKKIDLVTLGKYRKSYENKNTSRNRVSVIIATGNIVSGEGDNNNIGSDKFVAEIRKARLDDKVKAVVIRINSPGGSAIASDVIWREIELTKKEKPIIASMSDYAASGGYYMAMGCDTIVAQPTTITGSIGIFSMLFNAKEFLNSKLGITTDVVKTGKFSDIYTVTRSLSDFERQIIQKGVNERYEVFVGKAAEGRQMGINEIKSVASGRVWSGLEAKENNLVDVLGGLDDAIQIAVKKAGIEDDYKVNYLPRQKNFLEQLMSDFGGEAQTSFLKYKLGEYFPYVMQLKQLEEYNGVQARLPYLIDLR
ncbi:MAG: signal peptide peptidase SppA [Bacteroidota bacterium]|nr:signal peptide peptidase SppA [Bacteroidota bacterium]